MKRCLHIVLVLLAAVACRGPRIIPKDTLTEIYTDMFIADQLVRERNIPRVEMDTLLLYEAVFEKYGYDTDDYLNSVRYYLRDPERFAKVFENVAKRLQGEVDALEEVIRYRDRLSSKREMKHPLVDSLLAPFSNESVFVGLARAERDTSRYPAWFRLVAVQADTLMIPVDSLAARAAKDSLKAEGASDTETRAAEIKLSPERPAVNPPRGRGRRPKFQQQEILATEEVAEEQVVFE